MDNNYIKVQDAVTIVIQKFKIKIKYYVKIFYIVIWYKKIIMDLQILIL